MKYSRFLLLVILVLGLSSSIGIRRTVSGNDPVGEVPPGITQGSPFAIFPQKDRFVTVEGDPFIVNIFAECVIGTPNTAKVELLPPTPKFVTVSFPCRCENCNGSVTGLGIVPGKGNAGKYQVVARVTSCTGFTQTYSFTVKVLKAA